MMNTLFIVDTDQEFHQLVHSVCSRIKNKIELRIFSSSLDVFSALKKETPALIFLSLNIVDLDEFVMYDLLKKTNVNYSIPVLILYNNQSEQELSKYETLKFKAQGYFKKPLTVDDIIKMVSTYTEMGAEAGEKEDDAGTRDKFSLQEMGLEMEEPVRDENEFSDENLDLLVKGELLEPFEDKSRRKEAGQMSDTRHEFSLDEDEKEDESFIDSLVREVEEVPLLKEDHEPEGFDLGLMDELEQLAKPSPAKKNEKKDSRVDRELAVQVISLESQNEFLRTENRELSKNVHELQQEIEGYKTEIQQVKKELQQKLSEQKAVTQQLETKLEQIQGNYQGLQEKGSTESLNLVRKVEVLEKHTNQLEDEKSELTRRLKTIDLERASFSGTIDHLKEQNSELKQQIKQLEQEKSNLAGQIAVIDNEKGALTRKIEELSDETMEMNRQLVALTEEKSALNRQLEDSGSENTDLLQELEGLRQGKTNQSQRMQTLEKEKNELLSKIGDQNKQLEFFKNEKNRLLGEVEDMRQLVSGMEELKANLESRVDELSNALTDKERELVARNHQFEVHLKKKLDDVLHENEERLMVDYRRKEERYKNELEQAKEEKVRLEGEMGGEITSLKDLVKRLETERVDLKKREESFNRTITNLAGEKVSFSEKVISLEESLANRDRMLQDIRAQHQAAVADLNRSLDSMQRRSDYYKDRIDELAEILQKAYNLTQRRENA